MPDNSIVERFRDLPTPANYYEGKGKRSFSLPLNILFFYRDRFEEQYLEPGINFHYRHVLIFNCGSPIGIMVDGSLLELQTGCFTLLLPYQYHRFINDGQKGISMLFITFEMEENIPLYTIRNIAPPFPQSVLDLLNDAIGIYRKPEEEELPFCIATIVSKLLQSYDNLKVYPERKTPPPSKLVSEICRKLYNDHSMTIGQLSREMKYSEGYLRNTFKKTMGISLGRFLLESRLTEAMKYLVGTEKSISSIAGLTGYDNIYSFSRSFRTHMGMSPSTYRKRRRESDYQLKPSTGG